MAAELPQERVRLTTAQAPRDEFAEDVRAGLSRPEKALPCRYFYDAEGSALFEEICDLPEYYLTRTEREILARHADELAASLPDGVELVELGSGSSVKTRILIEAILREKGKLTYVPIDISRSAVEESSLDLAESYERLEVDAIVGEYADALRALSRSARGPRMVLWLGSSIGNLGREEAAAFLRDLRAGMGASDRLLIGIDLRKDPDVLLAAYDDSRGVTERFNKNVLARINRELGGRFDLEAFRHRPVYREREGRMEIYLESARNQRVSIDVLALEVELDDGERVHTENSHKYSLEEIDEVARAAGLRLIRQWLDERRYFSVNLLAAAG